MAEEETVRQDARLDPDKRDSPPSIRLPWLTPLAALVIGVVLAVLAISLLAKTSAEDPGHRCGSWGLPQLSLAGTVDRANEILDCVRHEGGDAAARQTFIQEARTALRWDNVAIPAYVAAIALWCCYAGLRARRRPTRHLAWSLAALAAAAGLADYGENLSVICGFLDADGPDGRAVDWAFAFSLARWIMLVPPTLLALGYLVSTFGQVMRRRQWGEPKTEAPTLAPPPPPVTTLPSTELPPPLGEPLDPRRAARFAIPGEPGGSSESRVGIGLSGGGIRAAAFSLGALQAFGETTLYRQADYLATVSGGGYVGGASQFLVHESPTVAAPFAPGSPEVAWTARRARFLWWPATPRQRRRSTRMFVTGVGAGLLGIAFNLTLLVLLLFAVVRPLGWAVHTLLTHPGPAGESLDRSAVPGMWLTLVALAPLLVIVGSFLWRWVKRFHFRPAGLRVPVFILLLATLTLGPGIVIRYGLTTARWWGHTGDVAHHVVGIVVLVALPVALALLMPPATANGIVGRLYPAVGWLLGLLAILLGAAWLEGALVHGATAHSSGRAFLIFVAVAAGLTTFVVITAFLRWLYHPAARWPTTARWSNRPPLARLRAVQS